MPATERYVTSGTNRTIAGNTMEKKLGVALFLLQASFVICFAIFGKYDDDEASVLNDDVDGEPANSFHKLYPMFQDVHVMIFIGFGFLMTFLRRYGYSAVSFNFLLSAVAIQWSVICDAIIKLVIASRDPPPEGLSLQIPINMTSLINGDFAAAVVLISFGVLLGKTSPCQLICMVLFEIPLYLINFNILSTMGAADAGGSMVIHAFGAYFGLACSLVLRRNWRGDEDDNGSVVHSDLFSMVGTVFLWIYWPSFNGVVLTTANQQHRTVINTYFSLCACCVAAIGTSVLVDGKAKLNMVHVQPYGAAIIGALAGILSTLGYSYVGPFLQEKAGLHDTCGVHNLHGMPAILAGLAGIVGAFLASEDTYGRKGLVDVFPGAEDENGDLVPSTNLAIIQAGGLGITLIFSVLGGLVCGALIRFSPFCDAVPESVVFRDEAFFTVPAGDALFDAVLTKDGGAYNGPPESRPATAATARPSTAVGERAAP